MSEQDEDLSVYLEEFDTLPAHAQTSLRAWIKRRSRGLLSFLSRQTGFCARRARQTPAPSRVSKLENSAK